MDGGTPAAYDAIRAVAGDFDVDQTGLIGGFGNIIDIGAQQDCFGCSVLDWSGY